MSWPVPHRTDRSSPVRDLFAICTRFQGERAVGVFSFLFGKKGSGSSRKGLKRISVEKRFELSGRTGQGSMSKVYRAYDKELGRNVCLKVLDKVKTESFEGRFKGLKKPSEGEICMSSATRTSSAPTSTVSRTGANPTWSWNGSRGWGLNYLVETRIATQRQSHQLPQSTLRRRAVPARQQVDPPRPLHPKRDDRQGGTAWLIDFGLTIPWTPTFCSGGNRTGTTDILAPEIVRRKPIDNRVDLFALGVTAYEVFLNQLPWSRSPSSEETFRRRMNVPPRHPKDLSPKIADDLGGAPRQVDPRASPPIASPRE